MYIQPDGNILLLGGVPLDNTYEHTLYWNSVDEQTNYFRSKKLFEFTDQSYQRYDRGYITVEVSADLLFTCNYLMFQNAAYSNKWFYAFIQSVEYANNNTAKVSYELDVMQTWFFDYTLGECVVEREHTATDVIGENTLPENLETGPYITTSYKESFNGGLRVYAIATEIIAGVDLPNVLDPGIFGGSPVPCYVISFGTVSETTAASLKAFAGAYASEGKADAIVAVFTTPANHTSTYADISKIKEEVFYGAPRTLPITPKNKKLYTYPYCCNVLYGNGNAVELRYELFDSQPTGAPEFWIRGGFGPNMSVSCMPAYYGGLLFSRENTVTISGYPLIPWVSEYYQNWVAQNQGRLIASGASAVATIVAGAGSIAAGVAAGSTGVGAVLTPAGLTTGASLISSGAIQAANLFASMYDNSVVPDKMHGAFNAGDIDAVQGVLGFVNYCRTLRPEYLRKIDDYFTKFGYAVHELKVPNRNVRPHWTFTKTIACTILGSMPAGIQNRIASIYDNGITFWLNPAEVGNYSLDNSV